MAYEKHTWECGETVTADKLNHLEDGVENAGGGSEPLVVNVLHNEGFRMDKTFGEIRTAFESGRTVKVLRSIQGVKETNFTMSIVTSVGYGFDSAYTSGTVTTIDANYLANVDEEPFTLEAIDAVYPVKSLD